VIAEGPLAGVRVLDLTRLLPGPMCTLYLADLGADVVKVEDTGAGDYARTLSATPGAPVAGTTAWYRALNRNKRSLAIDLKTASGHAAFMALARAADVIVEGFRPGVVRQLRVDYETVRADNPRIVYCAVSGYGQTGPRAAAAGHDINYLGYAGTLEYTGARDGPPSLANLQIADLLGGAASAAIGILGALFGAARTGRGRYVDVAMTDAVLAHQIFLLGALEDAGSVAPRGCDLLTGGVPCYGVYATRDGRFVAVGALEAKFWRTLCDAIERPDLVPLQFATGVEGERVRGALEAIFATATLAQWRERLEHLDCCVTPVLTFEEALTDPQFAARGMTLRAADGARQYAPPFTLSPSSFALVREAPRQGEHTDEVLREAGFDIRAIDALVRERAVSRAS
jgi:crotonobetainyl-CoA:carnitine CoA-transferase CaiB-like acyl-CoA transferase